MLVVRIVKLFQLVKMIKSHFCKKKKKLRPGWGDGQMEEKAILRTADRSYKHFIN